MKKLKKSELRSLERLHDQTAIENLKEQLIEKDKMVIQLKQQLYKSQIALLDSEQKLLVEKTNVCKRKKLQLKNELKEETDKIKKQHNIKGPLGYDPDSGEIKEN